MKTRIYTVTNQETGSAIVNRGQGIEVEVAGEISEPKE